MALFLNSSHLDKTVSEVMGKDSNHRGLVNGDETVWEVC